MSPVEIQTILLRALESRIGIALETNDSGAARRQIHNFIHAERRRSPENATIYDGIQFRISPDNPATELWIIKPPAEESPDGESNDPS